MPGSQAPGTAVTSTDESRDREVPGLLEVLARVPDPRRRRGRRYLLVFILAVAVACALAGARNFREAGDHATDLPQDVLARLGGRPHPPLRRIIAPSETRIRTLIHQPSLQRAVFDAVQEQGPRDPDHTELDRGHGMTTLAIPGMTAEICPPARRGPAFPRKRLA
jgi:hypothetical protein